MSSFTTQRRLGSQISVYVFLLLAAASCLWLISHLGHRLDALRIAQTSSVSETLSILDTFIRDLGNNITSPISGLLLQLITVLLACRVCGMLMQFVGQPHVLGEMLAGILLGPSVLQAALPAVHGFLFPPNSVQKLFFLSQVGLLFFMFIVGLELDLKGLKSRARPAILISHTSIALPFVLGTLLALYLFNEFAPPKVTFVPFALFMGTAMSITAFPVLARIIQERDMTKTSLGTTAITCAAIDDVTAWCVLAIVIGIVQSGTAMGAIAVIILTLIYSLLLFLIVKPIFRRWLISETGDANLASGSMSLIFISLLLSALVTETIGVHAIFGAFLMGVIMPDENEFKSKLIARIHDLSTLILLPLFFAFTGLRTEVGLLDNIHSWLICGLVILVAVVGKLFGSAGAALWSGLSKREAWSIGALMNTRGLMELVVLNIGYDLGILSPKVFTMMVIMALFTTAMTGPLVRLFGGIKQANSAA